ncbi:ferrochelatase [Salinibacterium xinjiangense]|uniref:Coproporphyrin III ferrochelatase n=1 Tax=Salinibacterium xinjiangense TaxID=386302 RepID=A0A2C9A0Z1_9MICO|nr:ferrochelatase [Salinibacterium xinjiangense]GGL04001.1 ferrochelatase [Salinibacterium xinjiangense]SOE72619.1 ferrochelatase [Salinibacterium xinjiangense]
MTITNGQPSADPQSGADAQSGATTAAPLVRNATPAAQSGLAHVEEAVAYDAILLASFGGPEGQDDVIPFLRNVTRGRGIPEERLEEVAHHYRAFGGVSPINDQNRELKAALEAELASRGIDLPVLWGNRNWDPYLRDALTEANERGFTKLIAIGTSAYSSYSSCRQYREDYAIALEQTGLGDVLQIDKIRQFFDHPGFVEPFIQGVRQGLADVAAQGIAPEQTHILFSTHSIPSSDADRSGPPERGFGPDGAYAAQHLAVAEVVIAAQDHAVNWDLVYQSRSGPPTQPWLEPDVNDRIAQLGAQGITGVVIVPLGFISDHMEVKWDLDTEAMESAQENGIFAVRVPTPGVHAAFVTGLVDLVLERRDGIPTADRPALTELGPWYDVCRTGCCENVRLGFKPAVAGLAP